MFRRVLSYYRKLRRLPGDLFRSIESLREQVQRQQDSFDRALSAASASRRADLSDAVLDSFVRHMLDEERQRGEVQADLRRLFDALELHRAQNAAWGSDLKQEVISLRGAVTGQARFHLPCGWTPADARAVADALSLLRPAGVAAGAKLRVGADHDGGYVMIDDFAGVDGAVSVGIGGDASWDLDLARRGIPVVQYDHTVGAPPVDHELFQFNRLRVGAEDRVEEQVCLDTVLGCRRDEGRRRLVVKIDAEGAEWDILRACDPALLGLCAQIVCEFHHLDRLAEAEFRATAEACWGTMAERFFVCHVHGNNCGQIVNVANIAVPESLEVTFANRALYRPVDDCETFPTPLDRPNEPGRADISLGSFRFAVPD